MRCHSASSLFSAVFVFQKSYIGNILGIGQNKSQTSYFYRSFAETEDKTEGGQGPGLPYGGAAQPLAAPPHGEARWLMTHKYRGSQQSSREVLPKFIDSTQGELKNICKP
jgi:hypothetical protein